MLAGCDGRNAVGWRGTPPALRRLQQTNPEQFIRTFETVDELRERFASSARPINNMLIQRQVSSRQPRDLSAVKQVA